jgi:hypothetical protein
MVKFDRSCLTKPLYQHGSEKPHSARLIWTIRNSCLRSLHNQRISEPEFENLKMPSKRNVDSVIDLCYFMLHDTETVKTDPRRYGAYSGRAGGAASLMAQHGRQNGVRAPGDHTVYGTPDRLRGAGGWR